MDRETLLVILAREAGYIPTRTACFRLNVTTTELLRMRRQMLEAALGVAKLPLVTLGDEIALEE
jgi:hypothetical protein